MSDSALAAVQAVIVALIVLAGQIGVARLSKGAQGEVVEVDSQARATEAWQAYAKEMKDRLDGVESRLKNSEERENENRRRIVRLEREREHDRDLIRRLVTRLRRALDEIRHLGGSVSESDLEVLDLSQTRLDYSPKEPA